MILLDLGLGGFAIPPLPAEPLGYIDSIVYPFEGQFMTSDRP
jgi:hypothetical protein